MTSEKPEGCSCKGPYRFRNLSRWTWGSEDNWYEYESKCRVHGLECPIELRITSGSEDRKI